MRASIKNIEDFQKALGGLTIEFSKLEFSLIFYCALIDNPYNYTTVIKSYLGTELEAKRKIIKEYIYSNLPDLKNEWDIINSKIGSINEDRRHLIHGIGQSYFLLDTIKATIKRRGNVVTKEYSVEDIKQLTVKLSHLLTGKNGLEGEFLIKYSTRLFDHLNETTKNGKKIVYRVNGKILTKWGG